MFSRKSENHSLFLKKTRIFLTRGYLENELLCFSKIRGSQEKNMTN
ncbi:hypothetical protein BACIT_0781 [Bacillus amyloliquefaciens]|nr:hypothetical protein BACIT_0781 [Bacillus amyloliquefaciens]